MTKKSEQILNEISQIAGQLEQQESLNAQKLQQSQDMSSQQQQQLANLEQTAAQKLGQIQQLSQQNQQTNQAGQSFQSQAGANNNQLPGAQSVFQPGFAGTNAQEVKKQNQQSAQNQNGGNFS